MSIYSFGRADPPGDVEQAFLTKEWEMKPENFAGRERPIEYEVYIPARTTPERLKEILEEEEVPEYARTVGSIVFRWTD